MQLLASGRQRAAKKARISVGNGATNLAFASWDYSVDGQDLPTENFNSFGIIVTNSGVTAGPGISGSALGPSQTFDEGITGTMSCNFNGGGDWDAGVTPLGTNAGDAAVTAPGLFPRDDLGGLIFDQNRLDPGVMSFPYARIRSSKVGANVTGKVTFTFSGKNQGPFNVPVLNNTSSPDNG